MTPRYYARSASNKRDNWPFWFVADSSKGGLNVTAELLEKDTGSPFRKDMGGAFGRQPFLEPWDAVKLAMKHNREAAS